MVLDAWESMDTGLEGWFWDDGNETNASFGKVLIIYPHHFSFDPDESIRENFSFADPRPREAPPNGMVVICDRHGGIINKKSWILVYSLGKFDSKGDLLGTPHFEDYKDENFQGSFREYRHLENSKIPDDLL